MRYPQETHDALVAANFFAPHMSEDYDSVGADALATCRAGLRVWSAV